MSIITASKCVFDCINVKLLPIAVSQVIVEDDNITGTIRSKGVMSCFDFSSATSGWAKVASPGYPQCSLGGEFGFAVMNSVRILRGISNIQACMT
jgi:hypothetical protein